MKKRLTNLGIMLFSTIIMLLICELFLRWFIPQPLGPVQFAFDRDIGLIHVPNQTGFNYFPGVYDYQFTNDENGFRKTLNEAVPNFIQKKIMLLGDSFTYGKGVNDNEAFAWKWQEEILKDSILIVNTGTEGRGTDRALRAYQFYKNEVQPDVVIYFAHDNDLEDNRRSEYFKIINDSTLEVKTFEHLVGGRKAKLQKNKLYNWFISHSHLAALVKRILVSILLEKGSDAVIAYDGAITEEDKRHTSIYLDLLSKEVAQDGRQFFVYYIPAVKDLQHRLERNEPTEKELFFEKYCGENNLPYHSFAEELMTSGKEEVIKHHYLLEGHWNANGHQLAAEKLKKDSHGFY